MPGTEVYAWGAMDGVYDPSSTVRITHKSTVHTYVMHLPALFYGQLDPLSRLFAVLAIAPNDADGLHCKLIAYMQLGEFEPALALISEPVLAERGLAFERVRSLHPLEQPLMQSAALLGLRLHPCLTHRTKALVRCLHSPFAITSGSGLVPTHGFWHLQCPCSILCM